MLNILSTASFFVSKNGPQISDIIAYLNIYLSKKEVEDYLDIVIAESYKIYLGSNKKQGG